MRQSNRADLRHTVILSEAALSLAEAQRVEESLYTSAKRCRGIVFYMGAKRTAPRHQGSFDFSRGLAHESAASLKMTVLVLS